MVKLQRYDIWEFPRSDMPHLPFEVLTIFQSGPDWFITTTLDGVVPWHIARYIIIKDGVFYERQNGGNFVLLSGSPTQLIGPIPAPPFWFIAWPSQGLPLIHAVGYSSAIKAT